MTGVKGKTRGPYRLAFIADNAAGHLLAPLSRRPLVQLRPGRWYGWCDQEDESPPETTVGVRWWVTRANILVATNHPHWTGRLGSTITGDKACGFL